MTKLELQNRTKKFAIRVLKLADTLLADKWDGRISNQIIRSSTSVAANYRASCRARSDKEFVAKLGVVVEESDETLFWIEIINEAEILPGTPELEALLIEANELTAIFVNSVKTVKNRLKN